MSSIQVISTGGSDYCVVLEDNDAARLSQKITWKGFSNEAGFTEWYNPAQQQRYRIIAKGLSMQQAVDQCLASKHQEAVLFALESEREARMRAFSR